MSGGYDSCCSSGPTKLLKERKQSFKQAKTSGDETCILVWIMKANNLRGEGMIIKPHSDPFAKIGLKTSGAEVKTWAVSSTVNNNSSPVWGENGEGEGPFVLFPPKGCGSADIVVDMFDEDMLSKDDPLDVSKANELTDYVIDDKGKRIKGKGGKEGQVTIRVASGLQSQFGDGTIVCTDVDDTLKVGRHWPAGCDRLYDKGGIYPGVAAFQMEVARGPTRCAAPPRLVILSARPKEVEACSLSHSDPLAKNIDGIAAQEASACMKNEGDKPSWGVDWNRAQYGSVQDGTNQLSYGIRKFTSFQDRIQHWGHPSVFVADDGQGDLMAATQMALLPPPNSIRGGCAGIVKAKKPRSEWSAGFAGSFIHRVFDWTADATRLQQRHEWIAALRGGAGAAPPKSTNVEYSEADIKTLEENNIFLFYTYDEAARQARDRNLISSEGFRDVIAEIIMDHLDTKLWVEEKSTRSRTASTGEPVNAPDAEACNCPRSATTEQFYEQVFQLQTDTFRALVTKAAQAPITSHPGECRFVLRRLIAAIEPKLESLSGTIQSDQALWQSTAPRPGKAAALVPLVLRELGNPNSDYLLKAGDPVKQHLVEFTKVLYIGSPGNVEGDSTVAKQIKSLVQELIKRGVQVHAGPKNAELQKSGAKETEMEGVENIDFHAIIVTPGGPGAEAEAKLFDGKVPLALFTNSADAKHGTPAWMKDFASTNRYDLATMSPEDVAGEILRIGHDGHRDSKTEQLLSEVSGKNVASAKDTRFDFGISLIPKRCSNCGAFTRNRGDEKTKKVYCLSCYLKR